jgi:hypothetical protein
VNTSPKTRPEGDGEGQGHGVSNDPEQHEMAGTDVRWHAQGVETWVRVNDPSAGSPTETLLRLLLPLNDQV